MILAFDTTGDPGGAAIFRDDACLAILENDGRANYAVLLFQWVERLMAETRLRLSDIDLFAVANGPGSFTGIRVGVAAAQGWARAFGRPVCGVSVLGAMTIEARPSTDWAIPLLDARRGEFYFNLFRCVRDSGAGAPLSYESAEDGRVVKPEQLAGLLDERLPAGAALTCVAREHDPAAQKLRAVLPGSFRWQIVSGSLLPAIARFALEAHTRGRVQSPAELDARYIRRSDAEFKWRE